MLPSNTLSLLPKHAHIITDEDTEEVFPIYNSESKLRSAQTNVLHLNEC